MTLGAATLQSGLAGLSLGNAITLAGAATVDTQNNTTTLSGIISGGGSLTKAGSGTLTLTAADTFTGGTTINAGTLAIGAGGSISGSNLNLAAAGATFDISAGGNQTLGDLAGVGGTAVNLGANTLTAGTGNSTAFAGVISGTGGLTKNGGGTLSLTGTDTFTGATIVNAGTLAIGAGGSIAASSGLNLAAAGAAFDISTGGNQTLSDLTGVGGSAVNLGANTLTEGTGNSTAFAGVISGTGGLNKIGTGTLTLSGNNLYSGATTVNAGTLAIGAGGSIAAAKRLEPRCCRHSL